jgi:hypothetical protein
LQELAAVAYVVANLDSYQRWVADATQGAAARGLKQYKELEREAQVSVGAAARAGRKASTALSEIAAASRSIDVRLGARHMSYQDLEALQNRLAMAGDEEAPAAVHLRNKMEALQKVALWVSRLQRAGETLERKYPFSVTVPHLEADIDELRDRAGKWEDAIARLRYDSPALSFFSVAHCVSLANALYARHLDSSDLHSAMRYMLPLANAAAVQNMLEHVATLLSEVPEWDTLSVERKLLLLGAGLNEAISAMGPCPAVRDRRTWTFRRESLAGEFVFRRGQPNIYQAERADRVFGNLTALYLHHRRLPDANEVLFVTEDTAQEEVVCFVERALADCRESTKAVFPTTAGQGLYTLVVDEDTAPDQLVDDIAALVRQRLIQRLQDDPSEPGHDLASYAFAIIAKGGRHVTSTRLQEFVHASTADLAAGTMRRVWSELVNMPTEGLADGDEEAREWNHGVLVRLYAPSGNRAGTGKTFMIRQWAMAQRCSETLVLPLHDSPQLLERAVAQLGEIRSAKACVHIKVARAAFR